MMRILPITAVLALLVAATAPAQEAPGLCATVEVVPITATGPLDPAETVDGRHTLDLRLDVYLEGVAAGDHLVELRLNTPAGHHYQTLTAPVTTTTKRTPTTRRVPGYPRPLPEKVLQPAVHAGLDDPLLLVLSLPVAGTPMISSGLYGDWQIEVLLDDQPMDCFNPSGFELVEMAAPAGAIFSDRFESGDTTAWSRAVP